MGYFPGVTGNFASIILSIAMYRKLLSCLLLLSICISTTLVKAQKVVSPRAEKEWVTPYQPFCIAGNLYYVGTYDLGCYLVTTPQGHILINTGTVESVPMIRKSIEQLGFKFSDIKILLATHAHFDHVGGMAEVKRLTGAKMMINAADAPVLADGGFSDYALGGKVSFAPVKADRLLHDHDTIALGGTQVVMLHHPGHTKGASSFMLTVKDENRSYRVLVANMPSIITSKKFNDIPAYPGIAKDYAYTLADLKKQQFDIWVASHASQFNLHKHHKPGDAYNPLAFGNRREFDEAVNDLQADYDKHIAGK